MKHIEPLGFRLDTQAVRAELENAPWDQYRFRTEHPMSPHREASDIWLRYNAIENYGPGFNDEHEAIWYPVSEQLPCVMGLVLEVLDAIDAGQLGGVLLTKIPPGKQVYPHIDRGWHAEHYQKFAVLIEGNVEQSFCYDDGEFHCQEGEAFTFNNQACHWVLNPTEQPRITLIICARSH